MEFEHPLSIRPATATQRVQSLWLVFAAFPPTERTAQVASSMAAARDPEISFAHLLVARRGQQLVGAGWVEAAPGKTAVVWPPELIDGEPESTASALFLEFESRLRGTVDLAQAIQLTGQGHAADRLVRHGFQFAATLHYLIWDVEQEGLDRHAEPAPHADASLQFNVFNDTDADRLANLIERTYVETQDIPILNDLREMDDVLDGYRQTGQYNPQNWFFVQSQGVDVGCLLLADHPAQDQFELIYMGVVPEARGRGFGKRITEYAKRHTLQAGRPRLILGVDADNGPALMSYTAAGFHWCQERTVYLKSFRD